MSSVKAVADIVEGSLDEDFKPIPVTAYGRSKLAAELSVYSYGMIFYLPFNHLKV